MTDIINDTFEDYTLQTYIKSKLFDPWKGTKFEGYVFLAPAQKGKFGQLFIQKYLKVVNPNFTLNKRTNSGHDLIVNGIKTEIKFGLATRDEYDITKIIKDSFIINHLSIGKDYDRILFAGINPILSQSRIFWFSKEDFISNIGEIFSHQQSGSSTKNDDYMCSNQNIFKLLSSNFIHSVTQW